MQNIDFSNRIKKASGFSQRSGEDHGSPVAGELKKRNRYYVLSLSLIIVAFTLGMVVGIQFHSLRNFESNLVKYPDDSNGALKRKANPKGTKQNSSPANFSNPSSLAPKVRGAGNFLVKVGTFSAREAESLATKLNNIPALAQIRPLPCRQVEESIPNRYLAFRIPVAGDEKMQHIFLGCLDEKVQAQGVLKAVLGSGLGGSSQAVLYEIE